MVDFVAAGFTEELFWSITPRQTSAHFDAARKRDRIERNMTMETAYYAAIVPHMKNPPALADLLVDVDARPRQKQTAEQRLASATAWAAALSNKR